MKYIRKFNESNRIKEYLIGSIKMNAEMYNLQVDSDLESKSLDELDSILKDLELKKLTKLSTKVNKPEIKHKPFFKNGDMTGQVDDDEMDYDQHLGY